ncbi:uncharacterized protein [Miscanthus floridulus]|uniref:uncharacterized protein n=1 Tax=Miscanthus floridulus TaxID=154761 RepID=UPI003457823E
MSNNPNCTILLGNYEKVQSISPHMKEKMSRASGLMLFNAILMGVVVVIGAYAPRYRRHPVIGAAFLGATALFLPIVSIIVTTTNSVHDLIEYALQEVSCSDTLHLSLVFLWTGVVVVIGINTSAVVAADAREGRSVAPPIVLLVKASWSAYLTFSTLYPTTTLVQLFVIMFAKLLFKYAAFYMARRSFALGRSPRLIAGYMAHQFQVQQPMVVHEHDDEDTAAAPPSPTCPALVVIGEDTVQVEQQPQGYSLKQQMPSNNQHGDRDTAARRRADSRLVTLDRVWGLDEDMDSLHQTSKPQARRPRDLCFSFALFKLLRCRFTKYTVSEAGFIKTSKFFRETLLRGDDYERVFGIIRDELSFINDYYYSSLPTYYSHPLLPAFGVALSLWSIGNCLYLVVEMSQSQGSIYSYVPGQIYCFLTLTTNGCQYDSSFYELVTFGRWYFDAVPLFLAIAVLVLAETREIVSYICSNWTKVALICHHVNQAWWQRSRVVQKCIGSLLKYRRCKLVNNWDDRMKQCSMLVLRRRKIPLLLRRLLRLLDRGKKVKVPKIVKAAIFETLKGESFTTEQVDDGAVWCIRPPSSPVPLSLYGCSGRQPGYTILVWHIATSVFEVSQLPQPSDHKTVATHLSRYCAYLVTSRPELLPDDAEWCRKLYDQVKKDADRLLDKVQGVDLYYYHDQLIRVLSADDSIHEVLRNGARLGKELVEDSAMGWEKLARFWVEMILYVAPSENLEAHAEAISQGGELITLLWAMLAHAGITGRLDVAAVAAAEEERGIR